jgi:hypothetical protein
MSAVAYRLKPWTEVVRPHEDIVEGRLEMGVYAANLGALDRRDPNTPRVYRDAREFFRTTYMTGPLRELLRDVLTVLGGGPGDRIIQLRTPFGGGKTHAMIALYHLMNSRSEIDDSNLDGVPDLGPGKVAVLSGIDLDPRTPRSEERVEIRTLWGELAYRVGGEPAYGLVREHDESGSAPGANVLRSVIPSGKPVLILLDEVLVYVEKALGATGKDPRGRQAMLFLQTLTEVVKDLKNSAMIYSLQASAHEAVGDDALLQDLDHLVARVDAKREPVSNEEVMRVVQRRLFPTFGEDPAHEEVARQAAREYAIEVKRFWEANADTEADRRAAGQEAERFERRVLDSYPFHPDLLDLMYHRWGSLPSYQRTRGALQFLASVVHIIKSGKRAQPLIGPGDVPLEDGAVRGTFFTQVGERERYSSVLAADITGEEARAKEVDRRIGHDSPVYEQLAVGTRGATAIMLFSFGGRPGEDRGVSEADLLPSLLSPELDRNVLTTAVHDLREHLLYLHYTGRRYRFEPKANLNLLIEQEAKGFEGPERLDRLKAEVARLLKPAADQAVLWPPESGAVPDGDPRFHIVYLGPDWADLDADGLHDKLADWVQHRGPALREYQNAMAFAVPGAGPLDRAKAAARAFLGIESLQGQVKQKRVTLEKEQVDELAERLKGAAAELYGAADRLYERVLVPVPERSGQTPFDFEEIDLRAQLAAGRDPHQRLLDALRKHVFDSLTPGRVLTLTKLGEERDFVACEDLVKWFYSYFDFPKLVDDRAVRGAIARGTAESFGYVSAAHVDGDKLSARKEHVWFHSPIPENEVDLGPGCFILAPHLAAELRGDVMVPTTITGAGSPPTAPQLTGDMEEVPPVGGATTYRVRFAANAAQLFRVLPGIQNLADRARRFVARVEVEAQGEEPFDETWLRNAVEEHFDEAGVDTETSF